MQNSDPEPLRWGIIGPGQIAGYFAAAISRCASSVLVAVGARDPGKDDYEARFPGARVLAGYDAVLQDPDVDIVYVATPHPFHAEWSIRAAQAGKHVLCEKPIGINAAETDAMFAAARRAGVFMGEAFMYRFHPLTQKLIDILRGGRFGRPLFIRASFGFDRPRSPDNERIFSHDLGGGGILDLGVYPVSMARLLAGVSVGQPFSDPEEIAGVAYIGDTGVDEYASATLRFPDGLTAEVSCGISIQLDNILRIFCERGRLEVSEFWFCGGIDGGAADINLYPQDGQNSVISVGDERRGLYDFEVDAVALAIGAGQTGFRSPGMSHNDSLGNMRCVDQWRASVGLRYRFEQA